VNHKDTVRAFINAINNHDVEAIASLMTDDHVFVDAHGNEARGKETMRKGWIGYFDMFPDYKIKINETFINGDKLALFGFAEGTFQGQNPEKNHWLLPASWFAIVENGKIKHWQVYCDTKIPFEIINCSSIPS